MRADKSKRVVHNQVRLLVANSPKSSESESSPPSTRPWCSSLPEEPACESLARGIRSTSFLGSPRSSSSESLALPNSQTVSPSVLCRGRRAIPSFSSSSFSPFFLFRGRSRADGAEALSTCVLPPGAGSGFLRVRRTTPPMRMTIERKIRKRV